MRECPIVDAHHHLWDLQACHYPWLMARGERRFFGDPTPLQRNYLVADFLLDASSLPLSASVHIQVGAAEVDSLRETQWLQAVADAPASRGMPQGIVAFCDLSSPAAPQQLAAQAVSGNLRGIRQIIGRAPTEDARHGSDALLDDPVWRQNLRQLALLGLSFDLQLIPAQMQRAARVLAAVPELRVALCHCGSPWDRHGPGWRTWQEGIDALAALPNVYCKLSGFGMFDPGWSAASVAPAVEHCIAAFGPRRCMFGSNFPVERLVSDYSALWQSYARLSERYSAAARARLFAGTATEFYRLEPLVAAVAYSSRGAAGASPPRTT